MKAIEREEKNMELKTKTVIHMASRNIITSRFNITLICYLSMTAYCNMSPLIEVSLTVNTT